MVIEAGVVAGYVVSWAVRKARRAAGRADALIDTSIDTGMDALATAVTTRLGAHPVLDDLTEEAAADGEQVSELTRQQVELAITAAARKDEHFGRTVTDLLARLRTAEQTGSARVVTGAGSTVLTGSAHATASGNGIAFGQVAGDVRLDRDAAHSERPDPRRPGRSSH